MAKVLSLLSKEEVEEIRDKIDELCDVVVRVANKRCIGTDMIVKRCFADELMMEVIAEMVYRWDFKRKVFVPEVV